MNPEDLMLSHAMGRLLKIAYTGVWYEGIQADVSLVLSDHARLRTALGETTIVPTQGPPEPLPARHRYMEGSND